MCLLNLEADSEACAAGVYRSVHRLLCSPRKGCGSGAGGARLGLGDVKVSSVVHAWVGTLQVSTPSSPCDIWCVIFTSRCLAALPKQHFGVILTQRLLYSQQTGHISVFLLQVWYQISEKRAVFLVPDGWAYKEYTGLILNLSWKIIQPGKHLSCPCLLVCFWFFLSLVDYLVIGFITGCSYP